jgi:hypothetical protein
MPVTPALWRLRQGDRESKASLGYIAIPYLKKNLNMPQQKLPENLYNYWSSGSDHEVVELDCRAVGKI